MNLRLAKVPGGARYYVHDEAGHLIGEYDAAGLPVYEVAGLLGLSAEAMEKHLNDRLPAWRRMVTWWRLWRRRWSFHNSN